jgi:hypothetical protein
MRRRVAQLRQSLRAPFESPNIFKVCARPDQEGQMSSAESVSSSRQLGESAGAIAKSAALSLMWD